VKDFSNSTQRKEQRGNEVIMRKSIDARGMQCPLPVIETKKALKDLTDGMVEVYVDNEIAVQNLVKMAKQMKLKFSSEKIAQDHYAISIEIANQEKVVVNHQNNNSNQDVQMNSSQDVQSNPSHNVQSNSSQEVTLVSTKELCNPDTREESTIIVLSSDHMGEGSEQLGKTLMKGFIYALTELEKLPEKIILYNGGAKLSVEGSDSLQDLKLLESQGVEILTCGTCLNFYEISEKLSVGSVTNMYAIAEMMMNASKIIKP